MTTDAYLVTGEIGRYPGDAGWHFLPLPDALADKLRARYAGDRPFGSLRVRAALDDDVDDVAIADRRTESYLLPIRGAGPQV
jgi:hypothetical protein